MENVIIMYLSIVLDIVLGESSFKITLTLKHQSTKMVKHTETIRRQFADKLFECVWPFWETGA